MNLSELNKKKMMMNKNSLYDIFKRLEPCSSLDDNYYVEPFDNRLPHKIGISPEGFPLIFVECQDGKIVSDINLQLFKVYFNRSCNLADKNVTITKKYTIIELCSKNDDFLKYFFEVVLLVLLQLEPLPSVIELKKELGKLICLFTSKSPISKEVIKGLWAEMFVIHEAEDPSYLIKSWHITPEDKYDFNDGKDKLEVKSTNTEERIHRFSIEQLNPNKESDLLIASVILTTSGIGVNIFDLMDDIFPKVSLHEASKIHQIVMQTIGPNVDVAKTVTFDFAFAKSTYKLFNYLDVPAIRLDSVPSLVSSVHFASCLKSVKEVDTSKLNNKLFRAL